MNSLGVFFDLNLKKSNDLMEIFDKAISKTNNLVETMDNYNSHKIIQNDISKNESTSNGTFNNQSRTNLKSKTYIGPTKKRLKPIPNNKIIFKKREPYNYQKEYENELINQIETLINPSYSKNGTREETGMLSFISPLINCNIDEKNKKFYHSKKAINKPYMKNNNLNIKDNVKNEVEIDENSKKSKSINKKLKNDEFGMRKFKLGKKNSFKRNGKIIANQKNKFDVPEVNELRKNRYFNRTKNGFRNSIVARDLSSNSKQRESNVDKLINKLKKQYS